MKKISRETSIEILSKYRTELMAIGIILVIICHSTVYFPKSYRQIYSILRQFCQIGVDIFMFLSGIGIYYSLSMSSNKIKFYKKRLLRILIPYIVVLLLWGIAQYFHNTTGGIIGFIYSYSLITFFLRGDMSEWYIAALIPLYTLAPCLVLYINRRKNNIKVLILIIFIISLLFILCGYLLEGTKYKKAFLIVNELMVIRIPLYIVGMYFGKLLNEKKVINIDMKKNYLILCVGLILFFMNTIIFPGQKLYFSQWYLTRIIFSIICIPMLLLIGHRIDFIKKDKRINHYLTYIGTITLELYLVHVKIRSYLDSFISQNFVESFLVNIAAVVLAFLVAELVRRIVKRISCFFNRL